MGTLGKVCHRRRGLPQAHSPDFPALPWSNGVALKYTESRGLACSNGEGKAQRLGRHPKRRRERAANASWLALAAAHGSSGCGGGASNGGGDAERRALVRNGSFRDPRTTSAQRLAYFR